MRFRRGHRVTLLLATVSVLAYAAPAASAQTILLPQVAVGAGFETVITFIHTDERSTSPANGTLTLYNTDGTLRTVTSDEMGTSNIFNISVPYQGVVVLTLTSTTGTVSGMARWEGTGVAVAGVATFREGASVVGVLAASPIDFGVIPLETRAGFRNAFAIANPGDTPVNVTLRTRNADGTLFQVSSPPELNPLPPNAQFARFVDELFSFDPPDGTLEFEVNTPSGNVAALPLLFGSGLTSASAVVTDRSVGPLVFPQVVDGGGYTTSIKLVNTTNSAISVTVRFFHPTGALRTIELDGMGTANSFTVNIPARGTAVLRTTGTDPGIGVGSAEVDSPNAPIGGVATFFQDIPGGVSHVGVPPASPMRAARIAVDTVNGRTGFALTEAGNSFGVVRLALTLQDGSGGGAETINLQPFNAREHTARFVDEVGFSDTSNRPDSSLLVQATDEGRFAGVALLEKDGVFSSAPVARQTTFTAAEWVGSYNGTWENTTFLSSGAISLTISVNAGIMTATMDLGGFVFGAGDPPAEVFMGPVTESGFQATANSPLFGEVQLDIGADGTIVFRAMDVPGGVSWLILDGVFRPGTGFEGTYELGFSPGFPPDVLGTWTAN